MTAIGVDLGGTKLAIGVVTSAGGSDSVLTDFVETPRPAGPYEHLVSVLAARVLASAADTGAAAVGVAVAAWLSPDRQLVHQGANLGIKRARLAHDLAAATGLPVAVENDANCAGWAEWIAAGRPGGSFVMLTLGTDVGGAVIVNGQLLVGAHGLAGELGHLTVRPGGAVCVCGTRGCLATVASGTAIVAEAKRLAAADPSSAATMLARAAGSLDAVTGEDVAAGAAAGEHAALVPIRTAGAAIAVTVAQIGRVIDPSVVVLGGGARGFGQPLLDAVTAALLDQPPIGPVRAAPAVLLSQHSRSSGVLGAGLWAHPPGPHHRQTTATDPAARQEGGSCPPPLAWPGSQPQPR